LGDFSEAVTDCNFLAALRGVAFFAGLRAAGFAVRLTGFAFFAAGLFDFCFATIPLRGFALFAG